MIRKKFGVAMALVGVAALLGGCFAAAPTPRWGEDEDVLAETPKIRVYRTDTKAVEEMDIERYVEGVLAGEMRSDWPMEALKAQAILARTYVVKFINEKTSKYPDADISTDIHEAQAYNADAINERIERAIAQTRGMVMTHAGQFPYAWFHAHAGGITELAQAGLDYRGDEPNYTQSTASPDSDLAPSTVKHWTATFEASEVAAAANVKKLESIEVGERGKSGRATTFLINGEPLSAPELRIRLGGQKLKSTLISSIALEDSMVTFEGSGYGHGVGLSQWGAYELAMRGDSAESIIAQYFRDIQYKKLWE